MLRNPTEQFEEFHVLKFIEIVFVRHFIRNCHLGANKDDSCFIKRNIEEPEHDIVSGNRESHGTLVPVLVVLKHLLQIVSVHFEESVYLSGVNEFFSEYIGRVKLDSFK